MKGSLCRCTGYHRAIEDAIRGVSHIESTEPGAASPGRSVPTPAGPDVVRGGARYTLDVAIEGLHHIKLLRSPHAHARIRSIRKDAAIAVSGVKAVLTFEDAPHKLYSSARHEFDTVDPEDMALLDNTVRFIGQRIAVVAETEAAPKWHAARLRSYSRHPPAVFDPEQAMQEGAPIPARQGTGSAHRQSRAQPLLRRSMVMSAMSGRALPRPTSCTRRLIRRPAASTPILRHCAPLRGLDV